MSFPGCGGAGGTQDAFPQPARSRSHRPAASASASTADEAGVELAREQAIHLETEDVLAQDELYAKLAEAQRVIARLQQVRTRLLDDMQAAEDGTTAEDHVNSTEMPTPAPEPAHVPDPPELWTARKELGGPSLAVEPETGQPPKPPETVRVPEEPDASDEAASHAPQGPADLNTLGWKQGTGRPLRPLDPGMTTLAVRNIPIRYTQERLLEEWPPDGSFNFLCRSMGREKAGHAFVNFTSSAAAAAFQVRWHGKFLRDHGKGCALDVIGATLQGYQKNLKLALHKLSSPNSRDHSVPAVFRGTVRLDVREEAARLGVRLPWQ